MPAEDKNKKQASYQERADDAEALQRGRDALGSMHPADYVRKDPDAAFEALAPRDRLMVHEKFGPAEVMGQLSEQPQKADDLTEADWLSLLRDNNLQRCINLLPEKYFEVSFAEALEFKTDPAVHEKFFTNITTGGEVRCQCTQKLHEKKAFEHNWQSTTVSVGVPFTASLEVTHSEETQRGSSDSMSSVYVINEYLFWKVRLDISDRHFKVRDELQSALRAAAAKGGEAVLRVQNYYGHVYVSKAVLGAKLRFEYQEECDDQTKMQSKMTEIKAKASATFDKYLSVGGGHTRGKETRAESRESSLTANQVITNIGGVTALASNPAEWLLTTESPKNWAVIAIEEVRPVIQLLPWSLQFDVLNALQGPAQLRFGFPHIEEKVYRMYSHFVGQYPAKPDATKLKAIQLSVLGYELCSVEKFTQPTEANEIATCRAVAEWILGGLMERFSSLQTKATFEELSRLGCKNVGVFGAPGSGRSMLIDIFRGVENGQSKKLVCDKLEEALWIEEEIQPCANHAKPNPNEPEKYSLNPWLDDDNGHDACLWDTRGVYPGSADKSAEDDLDHFLEECDLVIITAPADIDVKSIRDLVDKCQAKSKEYCVVVTKVDAHLTGSIRSSMASHKTFKSADAEDFASKSKEVFRRLFVSLRDMKVPKDVVFSSGSLLLSDFVTDPEVQEACLEVKGYSDYIAEERKRLREFVAESVGFTIRSAADEAWAAAAAAAARATTSRPEDLCEMTMDC